MKTTFYSTGLASIASLAIILSAATGRAETADRGLLSGLVTSSDGGPLAGVTVSAKESGRTITTSVFTGKGGHYYFPPMPVGHYRVWAQAVTFKFAKGDVDLAKGAKQNFTLQPTKHFVRQLSGDDILAALPDATPEQARMKTLIAKTCTGCHTASYPLQHKFDVKGWTAILDLMKKVNVYGIYLPKRAADASIETHEKELAAYLAAARGPGPTSMTFKLRPRPSGAAARVVFKEYDVPLDTSLHLPNKYVLNNGSDWSLGTPSGTIGGFGVHDAWADHAGNLWFTYDRPSRTTTIGRIDAKTGAYKPLAVAEPNGYAAESHGLTRDSSGDLWFNTRAAAPGGDPNGLAKLDPKAQKIVVYLPPDGEQPEGTLDVDGKGMVWVTTPDGALRFDPKTEKFLNHFKSVTYKTKHGVGLVYGLAGDADGDGWWLDMKFDRVDVGGVTTGKVTEIQLKPDEAPLKRLTAGDRAMYAAYIVPDFNTPFPWSQGPRRMGADKNGDTVWVGDSFGGNLARFNIHTLKYKYIDLPNPVTMQPYEVYVDRSHNVWTNLWSTDSIAEYHPKTGKWTLYDLPTRGTESRYISMTHLKNGKEEVVVPYYRTHRVAVMTFRSSQDIDKLKKLAGTSH